MNPLEDPARQKLFSDRVSAVFRQTFGEEGIQLLGGKFDVFSVARNPESELVVVGLRLSAEIRRSSVRVPVPIPPDAVRAIRRRIP